MSLRVLEVDHSQNKNFRLVMAAAIACYLVVPRRGSRGYHSSGRLDEHNIGIPELRTLQAILKAAGSHGSQSCDPNRSIGLPAWRPGRVRSVLPFWANDGRAEGRGYVCGIVKLQIPGVRQVDVLSAQTAEVRLLLSLLAESTSRASTVAYVVQEAFCMSQFAGEDYCKDAGAANDPRLLPMAERRELLPTQVTQPSEFQTLVSSFRKELLHLSAGCLEQLLGLRCFDANRDAGSVQCVCDAWGVATPTVALQVPAVFSALILRRWWSNILLHMPESVGALTVDVPKPELDDVAQVSLESLPLTAHSLDLLGDAIRVWAPHILAADEAGQGKLPLECSRAYVSGMASFVDGAVHELARATCQGHHRSRKN
eukprot:6481698-Amphidinium_carterae.1